MGQRRGAAARRRGGAGGGAGGGGSGGGGAAARVRVRARVGWWAAAGLGRRYLKAALGGVPLGYGP